MPITFSFQSAFIFLFPERGAISGKSFSASQRSAEAWLKLADKSPAKEAVLPVGEASALSLWHHLIAPSSLNSP
jgi:hypothetical protein